MFPVITVEGGPRERGQQYGAAARQQIQRSVEAYRDTFAYFAGWNWDEVRDRATSFERPINEYDPRYLEEIVGIAEGAGVDPVDVLAINVRTEIIFAATAKEARMGRRTGRPPAECSSFAFMGHRTVSGRMLFGQNWDWLTHAADTVIVLECRQDDGPDFVTVVEAGLLAKFGMNSAGIGLVANALVSGADRGTAGVPLHVVIRAIYDCEVISDALTAVLRAARSSSGNYVLAHRDGIVVDVEAGPGDYSQVWLGYPQDGVLLHTNHFINPGFAGDDISLLAMADSPFRLQRMQQLTQARQGDRLDVEFAKELLSDHASYPLGVCCHPEPRAEPAERWATLASVVIDLAEQKMWLAAGAPCSADYEELDYSGFLAKPALLGGQTAMSGSPLTGLEQ